MPAIDSNDHCSDGAYRISSGGKLNGSRSIVTERKVLIVEVLLLLYF